jgi:hypothetical protein
VALNARFVVSGLWAICAILGASTGLHREKGRTLYLARVEGCAVDSLSLKEEVRERLCVESLCFCGGPIVTDDDSVFCHTHSFRNVRGFIADFGGRG